jgi:hypothetical protein
LIYYLPFGINITSGVERNIFEKGTIFFGHPVCGMVQADSRHANGAVRQVLLPAQFQQYSTIIYA